MNTQSIQTILQEISMFSSLEESELKALSAISHLSSFKKGTNIFLQGDVSQHLMLLTEGVVSVYKNDDKGNDIVIGYFNKYALLAEAPTLKHAPLPSSGSFQTDGSLIKIDIHKFEELFITHPKISQAIIQSLIQKIDLLQQNIHFNIASSSSEKVLYFYQQNSNIALELKQYEIASILGITPETLSRTIKKLIKEEKLEKTRTGYGAI